MKKLTKEMFVSKAIAVHDIRYDYKQSNYKNYRTKVKIFCKEHGEFEQTPTCHLSGCGCPFCSPTRPISKKEFIRRSILIHSDLYDYSDLVYKSSSNNVHILCKTHGLFSQRPFDHLNGSGCPKCGKTSKSNTDDFIVKSRLIHGNKYNYDNANYVNDKSKILINCKIHGEFYQIVRDHLNGSGCPKCGGTGKLNTEDFIVKSKLIHGDKYNYDNVNYTRAHDKVNIECYDHGFFLQKAYVHMYGSGCPMCKESKGERFIRKALNNAGKVFHYQYKFDECKNIYPLPFDFAVETQKGLVLIEYQCEQHYKPCGFGGNAEINFQKIKNNDLIKRNFCMQQGYQLIEIPYYDIENIKTIISNL